MPTLTILKPWDWQQVVRQCSPKYKVINMKLEDFKHFDPLFKETRTLPFVARKTNDNRESFFISTAVHASKEK